MFKQNTIRGILSLSLTLMHPNTLSCSSVTTAGWLQQRGNYGDNHVHRVLDHYVTAYGQAVTPAVRII